MDWVGSSLVPRPFRARWKGLEMRLGWKRARMVIGEGEGIARHTITSAIEARYEAVICSDHCHDNRKQSIW